MVMLAAFDTTSREGEAMAVNSHQPTNGPSLRGAPWQGAEDRSGLRSSAVAWLKSMLAFHRRK